ncbi:ribosomal protein S2, flavodoxin-like domain-containing protein [Lipomyces tetrasporus]|uniref:Ribosomal protein S2, flavodoxin-like domain-containing protein n=1 Tax=Lipomyces tetrasporus TaxID=54092 RepID=A0AAD7QUE9_9ASCO|nr:ribosomal protein S2, flavodoxin-like domain-containing protein [Lipomyces tetrasporus]KAJ8101506.1 ribosomal protein S2, flavodoxin-like domain-containing protein [Lipomyces tetrasporus]
MISRTFPRLRGVAAGLITSATRHTTDLPDPTFRCLAWYRIPRVSGARLKSDDNKPRKLDAYSDAELDELDVDQYGLADEQEAMVDEEPEFLATEADPNAPPRKSVAEQLFINNDAKFNSVLPELSQNEVAPEVSKPSEELTQQARMERMKKDFEDERKREKEQRKHAFVYDETVIQNLRERLSKQNVDLPEVVRMELGALYDRELFNAEEEAAEYQRMVQEAKMRADDEGNSVFSAPDEPFTETELYYRQLNNAKLNGSLGAQPSSAYNPRKSLKSPPTPNETTVSMLVAAGAHLGHNTQRLRQSNLPFVYGKRDGIHIIDLDKTISYLRRACKVVTAVAERGGLILVVGTRPGQEDVVALTAKRMRGYHIIKYWVPGLLTNATQVLGVRDKKVVDMADREVLGVKPGQGNVIPDLVIVLNPIENRVALQECKAKMVPTIGVVDTDMEHTLLTYPIPANDDSLRAIELIAGILGRAGEEGLKRRLKERRVWLRQSEAGAEAAAGAS